MKHIICSFTIGTIFLLLSCGDTDNFTVNEQYLRQQALLDPCLNELLENEDMKLATPDNISEIRCEDLFLLVTEYESHIYYFYGSHCIDMVVSCPFNCDVSNEYIDSQCERMIVIGNNIIIGVRNN